MQTAQLTQYGGEHAVAIKDSPRPDVEEGKILVEVYAAGINPVDYKIRDGMLGRNFAIPATLGGDFSGVVVEIGKGVTGYKRGDAIFGWASLLNGGTGSFADYDLANPAAVAKKPKKISHADAAALPMAGVSAYQGLTELIKLKKGQKILIHGGGGGIGSFAIQIAKHLGAFVAATASARDAEFVHHLGADFVIDYRAQRFEEIVREYDAVFDTVGGDVSTRSIRVLKRGGTIVSMLGVPDQELAARAGVTTIGERTGVTTERLKRLAELVDKGAVKIYLDRVFPFDQADAALTFLKTGHPRGKVVLLRREKK